VIPQKQMYSRSRLAPPRSRRKDRTRLPKAIQRLPGKFWLSVELVELLAPLGLTERRLQWWDEQRIVSPRHVAHNRVYMLPDVLELIIVLWLRMRRVVSSRRAKETLAEFRSYQKLQLPLDHNNGYVVIVHKNQHTKIAGMASPAADALTLCKQAIGPTQVLAIGEFAAALEAGAPLPKLR